MPAVQLAHAADPLAAADFPTGQSPHVVPPVKAEKVPAEQAVQDDAWGVE